MTNDSLHNFGRFLGIVFLLNIAFAHAGDKYDVAVQAGAMDKKTADAYRKAERLQAAAETNFKKESGQCHSLYVKDQGKLVGCLTSAQKKFEKSMAEFQAALPQDETQPDPDTGITAQEAKVKNGVYTFKSGDETTSISRKNGKRHGLYSVKGPNSLKTENFVNGKREGKSIEIFYYDSEAGPKLKGKEENKTIYTFKNDKRDGPYEEYEGGTLMRKGQFSNNVEAGIWEYTREDNEGKKKRYKMIYWPAGQRHDEYEGGSLTCESSND